MQNVPLCTRKLTYAVAGKKFFGWCVDRMEIRTLSWRKFHSGFEGLGYKTFAGFEFQDISDSQSENPAVENELNV